MLLSPENTAGPSFDKETHEHLTLLSRLPKRCGFHFSVCAQESLRLIFVHHLFELCLLALQRVASGVALVALHSLLTAGVLMSAPAHDGGQQRLIRGGHGISFLIETLLSTSLKNGGFHHHLPA